MTIAGVTIKQGPMDWQIIQRDEKGLGRITISGTWETGEKDFSIQLRLVDENTNAAVTRDLDWQDAAMDKAKQHFEATLKDIPTGGLYRLETRLRRPFAGDRRAMRGDCVHHLGVGDIYVVTGQSNASGTGKGEVVDGPALGVHVFANDEKWKLAMHPLEDATGTLHPITVTSVFHGHSPWLAFGRRILGRTKIPIGLVPTALGGSPIARWIKDTGEPADLSVNMLDMVAKAGGRITGVLWHQGESDALSGRLDEYAARFRLLVALFRKHFGPRVPVITGQIGRSTVTGENFDANWTRMREIQRQLAHELDEVYMAVTVDCPLSDEIHNSAAASVMVGERYADLALEHVYHLPILAEFAEPETVRFTDATRACVATNFRNLAGDWTPNTCGLTFRVDDTDGVVPIRNVTVLENNAIQIQLGRGAKPGAILHGFYGINPMVDLRDDAGRCLTPFSVTIE